MLLGLTKPSSGSARVLGQPVTSIKHLSRIGFLPDVPNFYLWMRGEEFLRFTGQLFSISPPELNRRTDELLELTGLQGRSEEHTSELQSRPHLVCRLLLEKKNNKNTQSRT